MISDCFGFLGAPASRLMPFTFFDFPPWMGGQTIARGEFRHQPRWIEQSVTKRWERRRPAGMNEELPRH
jgi:hypothetical protein